MDMHVWYMEDVFHLDRINAIASNAKADRLLDVDRNDNIVVHIAELNISPENVGCEIVNNDTERGLALADESIHSVDDMSNDQLVQNSNGEANRGGKVLAYLVAEGEFVERHQIEFV